ncbi:MAG: hypothetical protein H7Z13_18140 [Ferruginibacter sp.]|nr:hypothetical protein [Ferruginibacter sp.]
MEMRSTAYYIKKLSLTCCGIMLLILVVPFTLFAQAPAVNYFIKDGKMLIELKKQTDESALDSFIIKFDLFDLDLKQFVKTNLPDSLQKLGWKLEQNNGDILVISKLLRGFDNFDNPADKIIFTEKKPSNTNQFDAIHTDIKYGYNSFRKKSPFLVKDSLVTFFLRNNSKAQTVMLAGSFNDWNPGALAMNQTDSGWAADVKLGPGKYWYKFIIDGNWTVDKENTLVENDGQGNDNSVFYKPNIIFTLNGFDKAKKVFVAGSFNNWKPRELQMTRTSSGWQLPLYLANGTHTYRFVADGKWMNDPENNDRLPNEFNDFNAVLRIGRPHLFILNGYSTAKQVILTGSFNNWHEHELFMTKTPGGWQLPYTLGPGNYEYRFKADGKWVNDHGSDTPNVNPQKKRNAYLIIDPNFTFRLKGFNTAKTIFVAGDFNNWAPDTYALKKEGEDEWLLSVHLSQGKHLYKFVVDGKWIIDPGNNLWEQNEFSTGNSVIWFEK